MSQSFRRLWQALFTVVGGDRRWLTTPLTPPSRSQRRPGGGSRPSAATPDGTTGSGEDRTSDDVDGPSVSDDPEAAILDALSANGGRLDQRAIPEAAGLSQSTVSRRLIALESRGDVNRYEIGRRKVVFVPGAEPDAFESPIDEDEKPSETPS